MKSAFQGLIGLINCWWLFISDGLVFFPDFFFEVIICYKHYCFSFNLQYLLVWKPCFWQTALNGRWNRVSAPNSGRFCTTFKNYNFREKKNGQDMKERENQGHPTSLFHKRWYTTITMIIQPSLCFFCYFSLLLGKKYLFRTPSKTFESIPAPSQAGRTVPSQPTLWNCFPASN